MNHSWSHFQKRTEADRRIYIIARCLFLAAAFPFSEHIYQGIPQNFSQKDCQEQQLKKPIAPKRGSQIFSSFNMISDKDRTSPILRPEELNQSDQGMEKSSSILAPHDDRENIPSEPNPTKDTPHIRPLINSLDLPGGPNYRPLVGGYAAAAYEAAKSLHYSSLCQEKNSHVKMEVDPKSPSRHRPSSSIP